MPKSTSKLINAYRYATSPIRHLQLKQMIKKGQVPMIVLFYHRVDDYYSNPWTISNKDFQEQIDWFQENFDLVSLSECQRRMRSGANERPTLSITFDDGYADNCITALPMLIERGIPVTYFVTVDHIINQKPFAHDVEFGKPLEVNSIESIAQLSDAGIEIGAHSRTHPDFGQITDPSVIFDEVIAATRELESYINKPIKHFAFPFGQMENLNPHVVKLCKENGFESVSTTLGDYNFPGDDAFCLHRIHGDPCLSRMKNWLTYDPRRLARRRDSQWMKITEDNLSQTASSHPALTK